MGIFDSFVSDREFVNLVKENDRGTPWAVKKFAELFDRDDSDFVRRVCNARIQLYKQAAHAGDRNAILKYAFSLSRLGHKREAVNWYMKLINNGDTQAMMDLSHEYSEYGGLGYDPNEELKWLRAAAQKGNSEAQFLMGREMAERRNNADAKFWYECSAKQNNPDGKAGYAKYLLEEIRTITIFLNGYNSDPEMRKLIKRYGKLTETQWRNLIIELYYKVEQMLIQALKKTDRDTTMSDCYSELICLYLHPVQGVDMSPYHAAFYAYESYSVLDNKYGLLRCKDIIKTYNLRVNERDLIEWEEIGLWEWSKKYRISI